MTGPLMGTRIVDLSERSVTSVIAGMIFADLGAEVIRAEPPGGDPIRALPGTQVWMRGQKSVTIGPAQVHDGSWAALRDSADVVINTVQPWIGKPEDLLADWKPGPRQILAILTATPQSVSEAAAQQSGPAAYGELLESQFGLQNFMRGYREGPIYLGFPHAANGAAWALEAAVTSALYERERTGHGLTVTTSILDGMLIATSDMWLVSERMPQKKPMAAGAIRAPRRSAGGLWQCSDGNWIFVHTMAKGSMDRLVTSLGRPEFVDPTDPAAVKPIEPDRFEVLRAFLEQNFKSKPARYWMDELAKLEVPCMQCSLPGDAMWLDQPVINGLVDVAPDGRRQLGRLAKFSRTPMALNRGIPSPGQHDGDLLRVGGMKQAPGTNGRHKSTSRSDRRAGPLDGVTVLDFGAFVAGPYGPRGLADLGARVIKIEEPSGDPFRGQSGLFLAGQRGKEGISLDLKSDAGREAAYDLVRRADVVYHNMRANAAQRLGIDYATLSKINPQIIYCHSSGYGNQGPWASLPAFEPLHSALAGALNRTAGEGNPPLMYLSNMDMGCGLTGVVMVCAALAEREQSGKGQYFEMPQTGIGFLAMSDVYFQGDKKVETFPLDKAQRGHAPTNALYATNSGWLLLSCYSDREWEGVRRAMNIPAGNWQSYADARHEMVGKSRVGGAIEKVIAGLPAIEVLRRLQAEGVPCTIPMAMDPARLFLDAKLQHLGVMVLEENTDFGAMWEVGHTSRFSTRTVIGTRSSPSLGEHTVALLKELGRSDQQIRTMLANKEALAYQPASPREVVKA